MYSRLVCMECRELRHDRHTVSLLTYDIIVDLDQDGFLNAGEPVDDVALGEGFEAILEFSTIAIPVAAIMGLLFLFSQRRKKEE